MRLRLGILLAIWILPGTLFPQGSTGHVKGEVWYRPFIEANNGFENVAVPNCEVVFRTGKNTKKIVAAGDGHFEADLPAGVYSATTNCPAAPGSWLYHAAVHSDFEVKTGSSTLLNLMTLLKQAKAGKSKEGKDLLEYKSDDLKSEFLISMAAASAPSRKVLVRYLRRAASKDLAEYEGRRDYRQNAPASVSFDALSIYADVITIEKPVLHIKAVGHVVIEDGKQRRLGNEATVEFDATDPFATLEIRGQSSAR